MMIAQDTRLVDMTLGDLMSILDEREKAMERKIEERIGRSGTPEYVYGLEGLMRLYKCSKGTAQRIKNSGVIDNAITQVGRKIIVNSNLALSLYSRN